jgi:hypothetical protein
MPPERKSGGMMFNGGIIIYNNRKENWFTVEKP